MVIIGELAGEYPIIRSHSINLKVYLVQRCNSYPAVVQTPIP